MKVLILTCLVAAAPAHAALTLQGVSWPSDNVVKVLVGSNGNESVAIEVPVEGAAEASRTNGLFTAAIHQYPAQKAGERSLMTIVLSQQGGDLASLYVLRQTDDGQYEYANKKPIRGEAPAVKGDLENIFAGLRHFNGCGEIGALEALVRYKSLWPESEIIQFKTEVEKAAIPKGEGDLCAEPKGPKVATPAVAPTPKPAPRPSAPRRAPRPQANPYGYPAGGYGYPGGGYGGGYGAPGYGAPSYGGGYGGSGYGGYGY